MLSRKNTFLLPLVILQFTLSAQDKLNIKFGKITPQDFEVTSPLIDSGTNAVVVADVGKSHFVANANDHTFSLLFTQKKRIKILNKNGFDAATVIIPLYVSDNNKAERINDLNAYTYSLVEGKVVATKVEKSSIFTEKHSKNWIYNKFTFPALEAGCIIEYSYEVKSDFFFNLQPWIFQGEYPVLWSQYEAAIPEFFQFVKLSQGYHPFFINTVKSAQASFSFVEHQANNASTGFRVERPSINNARLEGKIDYHTWVLKDVPGLKEEAYTSTLRNAISKIEFQLNTVVFPNSFPQNYMDSWEKVATDLMLADRFGTQIERPNGWLEKDLSDIVANAVTPKEKSKKIFEYVRDNFTWNKEYGIHLTSNLKDVYKNKAGSVADINLLLIAMLRSQKIDANPVILSTRDHGFTDEYYPLIDRYNYVIALIKIDNAEYKLDATAAHVAFGMLPSRVYNGHAREITRNDAVPIYFLADSVKEFSRENVYIINMEQGGIEGSYNHFFGTNESMKLRDNMRGAVLQDFEKSLKQAYPEEIEIDNIVIDSLRLLDLPVEIRYDLKFKAFENEEIVYFNPMLGSRMEKNPFAAAERYYPVEMPYTLDNVFNLRMDIPKGYAIDELPKSARVNLNGDEGMFEYIVSADKEVVQLRCRLEINKANFMKEDYQTLRQFYAFIVSKEAEQIVFKKIKQ